MENPEGENPPKRERLSATVSVALLLSNKREEEIDPVFKRIKDRYELEKAYDTGREALELDLDKVALSMFDKNERPELVKERLVTMYDTKERTNLLNENLHKAAFNTKRDKKGMPIWFQ